MKLKRQLIAAAVFFGTFFLVQLCLSTFFSATVEEVVLDLTRLLGHGDKLNADAFYRLVSTVDVALSVCIGGLAAILFLRLPRRDPL